MGCGASRTNSEEVGEKYKHKEDDKKGGATRSPTDDIIDCKGLEKHPKGKSKRAAAGPPNLVSHNYSVTRLVTTVRLVSKISEIQDNNTLRDSLFLVNSGCRKPCAPPPSKDESVEVVVQATTGSVRLRLTPDESKRYIKGAGQEEIVDPTELLVSRSRPFRVTNYSVSCLTGHPRGVHVVCVSPHDRILASVDSSISSTDNMTKVFDLFTKRQVGCLDGRKKGCFDCAVDLAFTPDSQLLFSVHKMEVVEVWDTSTFRIKKQFTYGDELTEARAFMVRVAPDGRTVAVLHEIYDDEGTTSSSIVQYDMSGNAVHTFKCSANLTCIAFSPDSSTIAAGDRTGSVHFFCCGSGEHIRTHELHSTSVKSVQYTADSSVLLTCDERCVATWDPESLELKWSRTLLTPPGTTTPIELVNASKKNASIRTKLTTASICLGSLILVGVSDKYFQVLDLFSGEEEFSVRTKAPVLKFGVGLETVGYGDLLGNVYTMKFTTHCDV